jgi:pimeloyl-ACP methyl ester carboxylesterase
MPNKYLHLDDRTALHYAHAGATTLPGLPPAFDRGATIVLLHGEGGSAAMFRGAVERLQAKHGPLAIDLPGHGRSSGLDGPASVDEAAALLVRVLDGLHAPPAVLVGHAYGGQVALAAAIARPDRARAVLTVGTAAEAAIPDAAVETLRNVVRGRIGQQFDTPFFGPSPDMAVMREFWGELVKTDPKVRLGDVLAYRASTLRGSLGKVACPVLVMNGDADRLCPPDRARELAAAIPGARLRFVEGAGHVAHLERPGEFVAAIEELVAP